MNKNFSFDQSTLRILYLKYKNLIAPSAVILVCIILFTQIIIPQIGDLYLRKEEERNIRTKIESIKTKLNILSAIDDKDIDSDFRTAAFALPAEKDFEGIFRALSYAAGSSGVILNDYGFSVGDVSTKSAQLNSMSTIQIEIFISGGFDSVKKFIQKLSESFPLSEIVSIQLGNDSARISSIFYYYKGFPSNLQISTDIGLSKLTDNDKELIRKISLWQPPVLKNSYLGSFASSSSGTIRKTYPF